MRVKHLGVLESSARPVPTLSWAEARSSATSAVAREALGHSSTAFTMDTYSHILPSMGERVAVAMEEGFGRDQWQQEWQQGLR